MIAFELIIKYLSGKASPEEARRIDQWMEESPSNKLHFEQIQASWLEAGDETMHIPDANREWEKIEEKETRVVSIFTLQRLLAAACMVGLVFLGWMWLKPSSVNGLDRMATTTADTLDLQLADASVVKLYPNSELGYSAKFSGDERNVSLKGDAFFTITPDKTKPFVIDAGICRVQVVGTSFSVKHTGDSVMVNVMTGKVKVFNLSDEILVVPGETAVCSATGNIYNLLPQQAPVTPGNKADKAQSFVFNDVPLKDVVKQLSASFNTPIVLENPAIGECTIHIEFSTNDSLDNIAEAITIGLNISVRREGGKLIFSGTCK
ncbi:MAG: FecR domain-containing protein [Bacteroidota bacterium]